MPPHLAYACIYWASHMAAGLDDDVGLNDEVNELVEVFATQHLLHWLEVLSIIGRIDVACSSLEMIYTALVGDMCVQLIDEAAFSINMRTRTEANPTPRHDRDSTRNIL
jgi:hypothetical protein